MSTLTQLRVRVRQILKLENQTDVDEGDPAQAEITQLINDCRNRIWVRLGVSSTGKHLATNTITTYTGGAVAVAVPAGAAGRPIYTMQALAPNSSSVEDRYTLDPVTLEELFNYDRTGVPEVFYVSYTDQVIKIRPIPNVSYTLYIYYLGTLTALSANSDTPSELPADFHQMLAYGAAAQYLTETNDNPDYAAQIAQRFTTLYDDLQAFLAANYQLTHWQRQARRA